MKRDDQEERTLSTADLADRNPEEAESSREGGMSTADALEPSHLSSREETDGRYDHLVGETGTEQDIGREDATARDQPLGDEAPPSTTEDTRTTATGTDPTSPLFDHGDAQHFQSEWESIQTAFVDEPRRAVEQADTLVADLMQRLAAGFAHERKQLEAQWDRGNDVSTEDLRLALQRYRSFFGRLLQA